MWKTLAMFLNLLYVLGLLACLAKNPPWPVYLAFVPLFAAMIAAEIMAEGGLRSTGGPR